MLHSPNTDLAYNTLIIRTEAQSLCVSRIVAAVANAKRSGTPFAWNRYMTLPKHTTSIYRPRWRAARRPTRNGRGRSRTTVHALRRFRSASAIQYQERTRLLDWSDYEILVTVSEMVERKGKTVWKGRVGETLVSDRMLAVSAALSMMLVVFVGWFAWARRSWIVPVRLFDVTRLVQ